MAFGIDFGTTNSSVAWADGSGQIHSLSVRSGKEPFDAVVRSVVLDPCGKFGEPIVGHRAFEYAVQRPQAPFLESFKLKLDKQRLRRSITQIDRVTTGDYDPVEQAAKVVDRRTVSELYDEHSRTEVVDATAQVLRRLLLSDEISRGPAIQTASLPRGILGKLVRSLSSEPKEAHSPGAPTFEPANDESLFIGMPVTVGSTGRKRMLSALARTGIFGSGPHAYRSVLARCRFVYEPLAIASTLQLPEEPQTILIVDYGGGSLDLALLDVRLDEAGMAVHERALGGLALAGNHLDRLFREALLRDDRKLRDAYEREVGSGSPYDRWRAGNYFTFAKIELSGAASTIIRLPGYSCEVARPKFEQAIQPALQQVQDAVEQCLDRGGVDAGDVGQVVLTGGSSLIPALQERIHHRFSQLGETSFIAARAGDPESEREALTGVSRGLANYGFVSQFFEATTPCDYGLWTRRGLRPVLRRGQTAAYKLADSPFSALKVERPGSASFALYSNLVRDTFCGAIADVRIPEGVDAVEIRVAASRRRFVPAFGVYAVGSGKLLGKFDLEALSAEKLEEFIEGDCEWLPESDHLMSAFLTRPLQNGDFVEWRENGLYLRGQVVKIRDVNENARREQMRGFDPHPYRVDVAIEEASGVVSLARIAPCDWEMGDVRLV